MPGNSTGDACGETRSVSLRFGNCNNGLTDGGRYFTFNDAAEHANWNYGAALNSAAFTTHWDNQAAPMPHAFIYPAGP